MNQSYRLESPKIGPSQKFLLGFSIRLHTHAVRSGLNSRIELCRDANGVRYRLDDCNLRNGDPLEVWTTLGWIKGDFHWEGEPYLPCLSFHAKKSREPFVIVSHSLCRRPE